MFGGKASTACAVVLVALGSCGVAFAKGVSTTVCGSDRCRTVNGPLEVATVPGPVAAPRSGRYYTISMRVDAKGRDLGWKVLYEAKRQIIRAADVRARAFLGWRWVRLVRELRAPYANAIRGLAPMRAPPPIAR